MISGDSELLHARIHDDQERWYQKFKEKKEWDVFNCQEL